MRRTSPLSRVTIHRPARRAVVVITINTIMMRFMRAIAARGVNTMTKTILPVVGWDSDLDWTWMILAFVVVIKFNHHRTRTSDSTTPRQRENLGSERIKTKTLTRRALQLELTVTMQHSVAQNISASRWITIALLEWIITLSWANMQSISTWAMIKTVSTSTSTISTNLRPSTINKRAWIIEGVVSANTALKAVALIWSKMELGALMSEAI